MKLFVLFICVALSACAGIAADQPAVSLADTIVKPASEILDVIQKFNLPLDADACRDAIISGVTHVADPLSRIMTEPGVAAFKESQQGIVFQPAFEFVISNSLPRIVGVHFDPAIPGIQVGDLIEKIDGTELLTGMNPLQLTRLLRGDKATPVTLALRNAEGKTNSVNVPRTPAKLTAIETVEELPAGLCYLRINGLFSGSGEKIAEQLKAWDASTNRFGVVIDLRGANGTDLSSVATIAGLFADSGGLLFSLRDSMDQDIDVFKARPGTPLKMPAMVLVDKQTDEAAEVLAAVLATSVRGAMLIGEVTAGNPMVRELVPLPSGQMLYIATRRVLLADGKMYAGREGVRPDIVVDSDTFDDPDYEPDIFLAGKELSDEEKEDRQLRERVRHDAILRRAADILLGLKALNIRGIGFSQEKTP